jgi:hypothetical protein
MLADEVDAARSSNQKGAFSKPFLKAMRHVVRRVRVIDGAH